MHLVHMNILIVSVIKKNCYKLGKEEFFNKLKNNCHGDKEIERTQEFVKLFDIKFWEELTQLHLKSDVFFSCCFW